MKHTTQKHKNRKMNSDTYSLRREVMAHVYEAKRLVPSLPRVNVRITDLIDKHGTELGRATMGGPCTVWIPASTVAREDLRHVVFHEILHAAYGVKHDSTCPLMAPRVSRTTEAVQNARFLYHANR